MGGGASGAGEAAALSSGCRLLGHQTLRLRVPWVWAAEKKAMTKKKPATRKKPEPKALPPHVHEVELVDGIPEPEAESAPTPGPVNSGNLGRVLGMLFAGVAIGYYTTKTAPKSEKLDFAALLTGKGKKP